MPQKRSITFLFLSQLVLRRFGVESTVVLVVAGAFFGLLVELSSAEVVCERSDSTAVDYTATGALLSIYIVEGQERGAAVCTAVLIASDAVLTAAHCTLDFFDGEFSLRHYFSLTTDVSRFGRTFTDLPHRTVEVSEFIRHPHFNGAKRPLSASLAQLNDLAVGFLARPVCDVVPAVVADAQDSSLFVTGKPVRIVGYGKVGSEAGGHRHHVKGEIGEVADWEIQIRRVQPTPLRCYGDSGGPTYAMVEGDHFSRQLVIGITSRSYDHSDCSGTAIDTRLDVYQSWIESILRAGCTEGIRLLSVCVADRGEERGRPDR